MAYVFSLSSIECVFLHRKCNICISDILWLCAYSLNTSIHGITEL